MDEGLQGSTSMGVAGVAEQIRQFGADHFIIGTDFGVYTLPTPVEGFREFVACLMDMGLTDEEIRKVTSTNPARLLGLD
jgi:microsomal dipeptidase-like Zn-dependent dipeptidase